MNSAGNNQDLYPHARSRHTIDIAPTINVWLRYNDPQIRQKSDTWKALRKFSNDHCTFCSSGRTRLCSLVRAIMRDITKLRREGLYCIIQLNNVILVLRNSRGGRIADLIAQPAERDSTRSVHRAIIRCRLFARDITSSSRALCHWFGL